MHKAVLAPFSVFLLFSFVSLRFIIKSMKKCSVSTELKVKKYGDEFHSIGLDGEGGSGFVLEGWVTV